VLARKRLATVAVGKAIADRQIGADQWVKWSHKVTRFRTSPGFLLEDSRLKASSYKS